MRAHLLVPATASWSGTAAHGQPATAQVGTLGTLEIELGGTAGSYAAIGALKQKLDANAGRYDLLSDFEIDLEIRGEDELSGLRYGATLTLSPDGGAPGLPSTAFVFVEGRFDEARFGDDAGVAENDALGGFTVAVGTGGTDGEIIDSEATNFIVSSDATKLIYYSAQMAGFRLGFSYAPHLESQGQDIGLTDDGGLDDVLEVGLSFGTLLGGTNLLLSAVAARGHDNSAAVDSGRRRSDGWYVGGLAIRDELSIAGGFGMAEITGVERQWINVGADYALDALTVSVNLGKVLEAGTRSDLPGSTPINLILGGELQIAPGLATSLELSFFDESRAEEESQRFEGDDRGLLGLWRIAVEC